MSKITVITINYNNLSGLQKTISSVINQTATGFEYIIIDGGSNDGSKQLIEKHQSRLSYWVSEADNGIYPAMNKGIKAATGEYLIFLNSGDYFFNPDTLKSCEDFLNGEDIVFGNVVNIKPDGTNWLHSSPSKLSIHFLGFSWQSLPHQGMFFKKTLFDKYGGYDESLKMVSDWAFYLIAIFIHNCSYKYIDQLIACYDFSGFSANVDNEPLQRSEREQVIKKYFENHRYFVEEYKDLKSKVSNFEQSRLVRAIRKLKIFKL
jgi:glycosyltransferase involved in cell wall biosynthesis